MEGSIDSTTMTALALVLTAVGGALTVVAYRRRGAAAGLKGLAWTLLPMAALLTGTLRLGVGIAEDVGRWATRLVFSPVVWTGIALAGVAVVLYVVAGMMSARGVGVKGKAAEKAVRRGERVRGEVSGAPATAPPAGKQARPAKQPRAAKGEAGRDEDMDEIEAILKKHGI
jgi:hypothetical protein